MPLMTAMSIVIIVTHDDKHISTVDVVTVVFPVSCILIHWYVTFGGQFCSYSPRYPFARVVKAQTDV